MKKSLIALMTLVLAVGLGVVTYVANRPAEALALAEFSVSNLSCGSCVSNIQKALSQVDGVEAVEVNVTLGKARVEFEAEQISAEAIAERISAADYPASLKRVLSAADYRALREEEAQLGDRYVGRIGEELISREDFVAALGSSTNGGSATAAWDGLVQRQLLLQNAVRNGVVVHDGEVQAEIEALREKHEGFDAFISERYGSMEAFTENMKVNMIINRNIEENVLASQVDGPQRRQRLDEWYNRLIEQTPVVIFDAKLKEALAAGKGGCGGGCCG